MHKFCRECGTQAVEGDQVCRDCGVSLGKDGPAEVVVKKAPITRKQKNLRIVIGVLAALIIGFSVWANSYHSAESVEQRFNKAIDAKDVEAMSKLAVHEDGTKMTQREARALLALVKDTSKGKVAGLSSAVPSGRFLGIYSNHKIEFIDQFVYYDETDDALTFKFNGKKMKALSHTDDKVVFGPMSPGIYEVEAVFSGKYGSTSNSVKLKFASKGREEQLMDIDLEIAKVVFDIEDYDSTVMEDAVVLFNKEKFSIDEDGETEAVGPFLIDGSQMVKVSATMPWGEGVSVEVPIDSEYVTIPAGIISDTAYKEVMNVLKEYGEEVQEVYAERDPSLFTVLTEELRDFKGNAVFQSLRGNYYTGSFNLLEVDRNSIVYVKDGENTGIELNARYHNKMSVHEVVDKPNLEEQILDSTIELYYDKVKDSWKINNEFSEESLDFEGTDELKGSGVVYKPSEEVVEENLQSVREEMENFMYDFHDSAVYAINERDFSYVADYHTSSGKSGKEARDYLDYLESKGITEDHLGTEVEKIEQVNDSTWKVTSIDEYRIIRPGSSDVKRFRSVTVVKRENGRLQMDELLSTDGI